MIQHPLDSVSATAPSRSVTDLLQDTASHTENVVRGEIRLAVMRVQEQAASKVKQLTFAVIGGVLGLVGLVMLLVASVLLLNTRLDAWVSTAIVGGVVVVLAAIVAFMPTAKNGDHS